MRFRKLRIAWSISFALACVLLIVSSVSVFITSDKIQSHYLIDQYPPLVAGFFMRGRMSGMSLKKIVIASLFVAQPCFISGCYDLSSGDRNAKVLSDRMKQIEKD